MRQAFKSDRRRRIWPWEALRDSAAGKPAVSDRYRKIGLLLQVGLRARVPLDTRGLLLLKSGRKGSSADDLDLCCARFSRLRLKTALETIQFYRLRERATLAEAVICAY